jgi:hypothetical protein
MKFSLFAYFLSLFAFFCLIPAHAQVPIISDDFSFGSIHAAKAGDFAAVGLGRSQTSGTWSLRGGSLINTGTNERGLGYIVDVSDLPIDDTYDTLKLSLDYTSNNVVESLCVHIYGYQLGGGTPMPGHSMVNWNATKGNAWTNKVDHDNPLTDDFIITNFVTGAAQGLAKPYRGGVSGAFEVVGRVGSQQVEQDFSLSSIVSGGPNNLDDYDYIVLVLSRRNSSASSQIAIDNLNLIVNSAKSGYYVDIPEPLTSGLLLGVTCFCLLVLRRRV